MFSYYSCPFQTLGLLRKLGASPGSFTYVPIDIVVVGYRTRCATLAAMVLKPPPAAASLHMAYNWYVPNCSIMSQASHKSLDRDSSWPLVKIEAKRRGASYFAFMMVVQIERNSRQAFHLRRGAILRLDS